ncbi:S-adenosyl-L-methionine-dependent methyltransferase [Trichoderma austrokoningii]
MENSQQGREDLATANRKFWNDHGRELFKQQWVLDMSKKIGDALANSVLWMGIRSRSEGGSPVKLLDYACGNGMVSSTLLGHFDIIRGIDISEASVASYNEMTRQSGIPVEQIHAVQGSIPPSLENALLATEDFFDFDLIAISMALHHIEDQAGVLSGLYERLRSGGVLVVIDLAPDTHSHNYSQDGECGNHGDYHAQHKAQVQHTISNHNGYGLEDMRDLLSKAGLIPESFDYRLYPNTSPRASNIPEHEICKSFGMKPFFIAKGAKK